MIDPLHSSAPLIVYVDVKSPYAYLAIEPTIAMGHELGIAIDWRPLTLNIPSYLGSARTDSSGKVIESNYAPILEEAKRFSRKFTEADLSVDVERKP